MATKLATATRTAACDAIVDLTDGGAGAGTIKIYTGSQPATANTAVTGTLLATFTLNDPAFDAAASGVAALDISPVISTTGVAAGDAGYFRLEDSTGADILDGSVTATGGGGQLTINTVTVSVGVDLTITSLTVTVPAE
jgi:hypothetical protein